MKKKASRFFLLPLVALIVGAVVLALPSDVLATSTATENSVVGVSGSGTSGVVTNGNLTNHGGPVMNGTALAYLIFWEPKGHGVTANYNALVTRWFQDVGGSGLYNNNKQYTSGGKAPVTMLLGGTFLDTHAYPTTTSMTDAQVHNEVTYAMGVKHWTASIQHIFFVYTGAGERNAIADQNSFCAYHSSFGNNTIYAAMVYPTVLSGCLVPLPSPNHDQIADSAIHFSSHEQMEAVTDPLLNAWYHVDTGHEIADECAWNFGTRNSITGANVTYHNHPYVVQQEWDNKKSGCTLVGP